MAPAPCGSRAHGSCARGEPARRLPCPAIEVRLEPSKLPELVAPPFVQRVRRSTASSPKSVAAPPSTSPSIPAATCLSRRIFDSHSRQLLPQCRTEPLGEAASSAAPWAEAVSWHGPWARVPSAAPSLLWLPPTPSCAGTLAPGDALERGERRTGTPRGERPRSEGERRPGGAAAPFR